MTTGQASQDLATKADIGELRLDIAQLEARIQAMLNRHLLAVLGAVATVVALVKLL